MPYLTKYLTPEKRLARERDLELMRQRHCQRLKEQPSSRVERRKLNKRQRTKLTIGTLKMNELRFACEVASRIAGNPLLKDALLEAASYFADVAAMLGEKD